MILKHGSYVYGNSEHVAQVGRKTGLLKKICGSIQMYQIADYNVQCTRAHLFWVTI